jgi:tetratricopeptide (TPR) repeat protein
VDAAAGLLVRARHDLDRGRPDRALAALESVTGDELDSTEFWRLRTHALYETGRWKEAAESATHGLTLESDDIELLDALALAQLETGRKKEARATIEGALALYPDVSELHAHHGLILARSAKKSFRIASYKDARAAVARALDLDPECEAALQARAQVAMLSNDPLADAYAADLLARQPDDEFAHVLKGAAVANRGDVTTALRHYDEAARLDPSDPTLAWLGRRSRLLKRPFFAPLLFLERVTHGRVRYAWIAIVFASIHAHQPLLTAAVFAFWVYMWVAHGYLRLRTGKEPS